MTRFERRVPAKFLAAAALNQLRSALMSECGRGSKLGAVIPRHAPPGPEKGAARRSPWQGRGPASPVASLTRQGAFAPPAPTTKGRPCPLVASRGAFLPPRPQTNPARIGCAATACPVASTIGEPCPPIPPRQAFAPDTTTSGCPAPRPRPTLRGLDARQRPVPLHRHSGPCPEAPRRSPAPAPGPVTR